MDIWTRYNNQDEWKEWPEVLSGIASLWKDQHAEALFVCEKPLHEMDTLLSGIAVVHRICGTSVSILAACPYPSQQWISTLKAVGVDPLWSLSARGQRLGRASLENVVPLSEAVCPTLHTREDRGEDCSVCGCHNDRMVLARHYLEKWCLEKKDECPHWNEKAQLRGNENA